MWNLFSGKEFQGWISSSGENKSRGGSNHKCHTENAITVQLDVLRLHIDEPARVLECALKPLDALGLLWGRACSGLDEEVSLDLGCVTSFHSENRRFRSARGDSREGGRAFD